jgi:LuxR family maltose regulon positive regulatory protein
VAEFSGSDRTVAEYLLAEMLDRQPDEIQQLLLGTSLLDRVNGELADLLTGRSGSERILLELEEANAFVVSLDPERRWFRYHHLLGDFLRLELRRTRPEEVPALHRRAAGWFTRHGQVVEAIRHTQAAGDWSEAARLLADHSFSLTLDGQAQTIQALVRAFPQGAADDPELALVRAADDLLHGHLDEAAALLAVAETYVKTAPPDRQRRLRVAVVSLKLGVVTREVVDSADRWQASESGVGTVMVVPVDPGLQGSVTGGVGAIQPPIGPLLQQGAVEPLHLPVGLRPIRPGPLVAYAGVGQRGPEQPAAVADPVVGEHALGGDAMLGEPAVGAPPEPSAALSPLVAQEFHIGQAGVVVDRGMQVVIAAA